MTSRGNQSVSPPAAISQQRHVNDISSNTALPQQYYQGPPSALSQGAYEFLPQAQGHPFNPYQAYGSSLSDTRGQPGNSGRGVAGQQNLPQGNNYYQQSGANIRPQQAQQSHTYYITAQPQGNMRHPRPSHQSQMMFISQNFQPANSVITVPANMYPSARVPMYPPNPFVQGAPSYPNIVYYQNGSPAWRAPAIPPTAAPAPRPVQREKKVLSIMDPDTGRDITEELLNSRSHPLGAEEHHEDPSAGNQNEICQTFTRLVAESLKSPDDSNTSGVSSDSHGAEAGAAASAPSNEQHQPLLPHQPTQQPQPSSIAAPAVLRPAAAGSHNIPPTHSGLPQQAPATAAQPHDSQHQVLNVNLSMPPPQYPLRQPTQAVYAAVSQQHQHPAHHAPRHTQPSQQNSVRPPTAHLPPQQTQNQPPQAQNQPPQVQNQPPQAQNQAPQAQHQPPQVQHQPPQVQHQPPQAQHQPPQAQHQPPQAQHQPPQAQHQPPQAIHSQPPSTVIDPAPQPKVEPPCVTEKPKPPVDATPQDNIPAKHAPPPSSTVAPTPVPCPVPQAVEDADVKPSLVKPVDSEEASIINKTGDNGRLDASQGVISQGMKDGRKGKKGKKDFNRKDIGGSDMDAFIDSFENTQENRSNPMKTKAEPDSASLLSNKGRETGTTITAKNVLKRDPKNPWNIPSTTNTSAKTDAHNPWAVKGQESAPAKLPVSISSAAQGMSERPNPWRIVPVTSLEENPVRSSEITQNTVSEASRDPQGAISKQKLRVCMEGSRVMPTMPSSKYNRLLAYVSSSAPKSKGAESHQKQCEVQNTKTHLSHKIKFPKNERHMGTSDTPVCQGRQRMAALCEKSAAGSLFENPWHRKLPAVVLNTDGKHDARTVVTSVNSRNRCVTFAKQNDVHCCDNRAASSDSRAVQNGSAQEGVHRLKNTRYLAPAVELICSIKQENLPCSASTSSVVASGPSRDGASESTKINCNPVNVVKSLCSVVEKPPNRGTADQPVNISRVHKMCISIIASQAGACGGQGSLDSGTAADESNSRLKLQVPFSV